MKNSRWQHRSRLECYAGLVVDAQNGLLLEMVSVGTANLLDTPVTVRIRQRIEQDHEHSFLAGNPPTGTTTIRAVCFPVLR